MKNKIKAMLTLVMGYFIYECALSIRVDKYPIPSILKGYIGTLAVNLLAVFFLVYVYNTYVLKQTFKDIHVCKPLPVKKWVIAAFVLSISVFLCCICFVDGTWVKEELTKEQTISAIAYTILQGGLRAGIAEELIWRGLILGSLQKGFGKKIAIIVSAFGFACIHLGNIDISNIYNVMSLLLAITIIGCAFALLVYETGSIWTGVVFHGVYNILSGDLDIFHIASGDPTDISNINPHIWTYTPIEEARWIRGISGSCDIETGLPAMIGFLLVIFFAYKSLKKKNPNFFKD